VFTFWQDLKFGLRMLARNPGFTAVAVFTLALGIGANSAIFSVVNAVLLKRLPYPDPARLVTVFENQANEGPMSLAWPNFVDWRDRIQAFENVAATRQDTFTLTGQGPASRVYAAQVTPTFFPLLSVTPRMGRAFTSEEDLPGAAPVVLLTDSFWRINLSSDPNVLGKSLVLDSVSYTVIGVLPAELKYFPRSQLYLPLGQFSRSHGMDTRGNHQGIRGIARLRQGTSVAQAQSELDAVMRALEKQYPVSNGGVTATVTPFDEYLFHDTRTALLLLFGAVGLVLLIACANIANLFLARATARQKEFALRTTLGAAKGRLIRQLLTESLLFSVAGGALGLLLANWSIGPLLRFAPPDVPRLADTQIDWRVMSFTLAISIVTGILFGLAPAFHVLRFGDLGSSLKETGASVTSTRSRQRLRSVLLVFEVALAIVLVISSGLIVRSIVRVLQVKLGANPDHVLALDVYLSGPSYAKPEARNNFFQNVIQRIQRIPGVVSAGSISCPPFGGTCWTSVYIVEGRPVPAPSDLPSSLFNVADPNFFRTMQVPLLAGRYFNETDIAGSAPVAIINETMARQWWPNESALGKRIKQGFPEDKTPFREVVGVVGDVKEEGPDMPQRPEVYFADSQEATPALTLLVRTGPEPMASAKTVANEIHAIDPDQAVDQVQPLSDYLETSLAWRKSIVAVLGIFGILALGLAAVGIYGVMSYIALQRSREIGIRMAMGAKPRDVLAIVISQGLRLVGIGIVTGIAAGVALTHLMSSLLFGVSPTDPLTFVGVALLLTLVALAACYIPARRAMRVDPMVALRYE
jgi:putative ABC transport system permease protein